MGHICVIGGGASGCIAAIEAAKLGNSVTIIEKNNKLLKKVSASGNGRCNFTNKNIDASIYHSDDNKFIEKALSKFTNTDLISFFNSLGIIEKEKDGLFYPLSNKSESITSVLQNYIYTLNIEVITMAEVISIDEKSLHVTFIKKNVLKEGTSPKNTVYEEKTHSLSFDKIIISAGSPAGLNEKPTDIFKLTEKLSLMSLPFEPALTGFHVNQYDKKLSGVRAFAKVTYKDHSEIGELQFNDMGLSGVCLFQLSLFINEDNDKEKKLSVDFVPERTEEDLLNIFNTKCEIIDGNNVSTQDFFKGIVPDPLMNYILSRCNIPSSLTLLKQNDFVKVTKCLKNHKFYLNESFGIKNSQVCLGGISLSELHEDFSLIKNPNIYITGEALNVAGICGGYNLQWAFTSGHIAGISAGK